MAKTVGQLLNSAKYKYVRYAKQNGQNVEQFKKTPAEPFPFLVTEDNKLQTLRNIMTPLHDIPYEEQLSTKASYCKRGLRLLTQQLYRSGTAIRQDVNRLPCRFKPIVGCPVTEQYRSKDEFGIWRGIDGQTETVGFWVFPVSRHGDTVSLQPEGIITMRPDVIKLVELLNKFIQGEKKLPISYSLGHDGGWRRFTIRSNQKNELMLIGVVNPRTLKVQQIIDEKKLFRDFITKNAEEANLKLSSVFFQACPSNKCSHDYAPFELLDGKPFIEEEINNTKVLISPESYIQENTSALEMLHKEVRTTIEECFQYPDGMKPNIVDAMCGSGLLSINLADLATRVIGIDHVGQSIEVARRMAELNKITNCEFINTSFEIIIEQLFDKLAKTQEETLLVAHVAKKGLLPFVATAIRECESVRRIIYITPKIEHDNCQKDLMRLCQKESGKTGSLPPFIPVQATPVDMLPHCEGCNLIIALERVE